MSRGYDKSTTRHQTDSLWKSFIELIEIIRQNIQKNEFTVLKSQIEELKIAMKDMVTSKPLTDNNLNSDPKSTLNDL